MTSYYKPPKTNIPEAIVKTTMLSVEAVIGLLIGLIQIFLALIALWLSVYKVYSKSEVSLAFHRATLHSLDVR